MLVLPAKLADIDQRRCDCEHAVLHRLIQLLSLSTILSTYIRPWVAESESMARLVFRPETS
jgi:hypothetical protein